MYKGECCAGASVGVSDAGYSGMVPELFRGVGGSLVIVIYDRIKVIFGI